MSAFKYDRSFIEGQVRKGRRYIDIAIEVGCSPCLPSYVGRRIGIKRQEPRPRHDEQIIAEITRLKGVRSAAEIGREFQLSRNAVIGIWHRHAKAASA